MKTFEIITTEEVAEAFENTNFGETDPRDVIFDTLRKVCTGYSTGRTATLIAIDFALIDLKAKHLTEKGFQYLQTAIEESK
jgi:L-alanine-DL-glutamate epimerase-like enolase superfamily enzyme